jgi:uncharacterized membrane protein (DUF373 family)
MPGAPKPNSEVSSPRIDRGAGAVEVVLYCAIAVVLIGGAVVMLVQSAYNLVADLDQGAVAAARAALDSLLLTFIFVELFGAVRVTINERTLVAEPFFLVGIIAGIKEIILLVGTENLSTQEWEKFRNGIIEVGVLAAVILVLTFCTVLVRRRMREPAEHDG